MSYLAIDIEDLRKNKNYEEVAEIAEKMINDVEEFEEITKKELIRLMAEKLEQAGYPILEIREKITERLGINKRVYISRCLDDRFKNPKRVAAGQAIRAAEKQTNTGQVLQELEFKDKDDDNDSSTEADVTDEKYLAQKNWETPDYGDNNNDDIDDGEPKLTTITIPKLDVVNLNRLINATTASKAQVYLTIDTRTNQVRDICSDVEWHKKQHAH